MAEIKTMNVRRIAKDTTKQRTITLKLEGTRIFSLRLKIAVIFFKIGSWFAYSDFKVEE